MGRTLLLLLGAHTVGAQIFGATCSYFDREGNPVNETYALSQGFRRLCVPAQCPSPELKRGDDLYVYTKDNQSLKWHPGFGGYFYEQICETCHTDDASIEQHRKGGDKLARDYEKGCAAMYPLPDLLQSTCQSLIPLWVILILYIFWALALVCEEFLQPAISILCTKLDIPDNVAGATLLAAGCNAPELFASVIAIFISNSPVGVGTVVGSAPFNVCCITGGSALAIGGALALDPWLMGRETIGLLVPAVLFLVFMDDYLILWWEALILVVYYVFIYVPVLCYFDNVKASIIRACLCLVGGSPPVIPDDQLPRIGMSPAASFSRPGLSGREGLDQPSASASASGVRRTFTATLSQTLSSTLASSTRITFDVPSQQATLTWKRMTEASARLSSEKGTSSKPYEPQPSEPQPSSLSTELGAELMPVSSTVTVGESVDLALDSATRQSITTWEALAAECRNRAEGYTPGLNQPLSGVLLKKSRFYTKVHVTRLKWQARHFIIDSHQTNPCRYSRVDKKGMVVNEKKFVTVPLHLVSSIERASLVEVHLVTPGHIYKFRVINADRDEQSAGATAQMWFDRFVVAIDEVRKAAAAPLLLGGEEEDDEGHGAWDRPSEDAGALGKAMFYATFPLKWCIFMTTPFVMHKSQEHKYIRCALISSLWLAVLAFGMTECVEYLGCAIAIEPTAMGLSLGAIGTSFPNLYASILIARAGDGVTAVCQAIASNTFNICIGLALFWLLKTIGLTSCNYGSDGRSHQAPCNGCYGPVGTVPLCPYLDGENNMYGSSSGSTKGAILVVFVWMAFFVLTMVVFKSHVYFKSACFMFSMYIVYMIYQILNAYGVPITLCVDPLNICI